MPLLSTFFSKTYFLVAILFILNLASCSDGNLGFYQANEHLCLCNPFVTEVHGYNFYVPNTFTPNNDGINDNFYIFSNCFDCTIEGIYIYSIKKHRTYFSKTFDKYKGHPNNLDDGWNGKLQDLNIFGEFNYSFEIKFADGKVEKIKGTAYSLPCISGLTDSKAFKRCTFGTQHNGNGGIDKFASTGEKNCE